MRLKLFLLSLVFCLMAAVSAHAADMTARQTAEAGADRIHLRSRHTPRRNA